MDIFLAESESSSETIRRNSELWFNKMSVFADCNIGPSKTKRGTIVLIVIEKRARWFFSIHFLFHLHVQKTNRSPGTFAFRNFFNVTFPIDKVDEILNRLCLRWATENKLEQSAYFNSWICDTVEIEKWYRLELSSFVRLVHQLLRSNHSVETVFSQMPWPAHRFQVNRFS